MVAFALALLGMAWQSSAQEPVADPVADEITVSEASALVDFGSAFSRRQLRRLNPGEIVVLESGEPREAARLEPAISGRDDRWTSVLYFDAVLSARSSIVRAAGLLGGVAEKLTTLGDVVVVVANPNPEELLRTRSAIELQDVLAILATVPPGGADPELGRSLLQADRLLSHLGAGCSASACALFLVADGCRLEGGKAEEFAHSLSVLEWLTTVLVLPPAGDREPVAVEPRDPNAVVDSIDRGPYLDGVRIGLGRRARVRAAEPVATRIDLESQLDADLAVLIAAARETSGRLVRELGALERGIASLGRRQRVWYRTPRSVEDGILEIDVLLRDGRSLAAPGRAGASIPSGVSAARARSLLRREGPAGDLIVENPGIENGELSLEVRWPESSSPRSSASDPLLRVTLAIAGPSELPRVVHVMALVAHGGARPVRATVPRYEELLEGFASSRDGDPRRERNEIAIVVEDLRSRAFGTALLSD